MKPAVVFPLTARQRSALGDLAYETRRGIRAELPGYATRELTPLVKAGILVRVRQVERPLHGPTLRYWLYEFTDVGYALAKQLGFSPRLLNYTKAKKT